MALINKSEIENITIEIKKLLDSIVEKLNSIDGDANLVQSDIAQLEQYNDKIVAGTESYWRDDGYLYDNHHSYSKIQIVNSSELNVALTSLQTEIDYLKEIFLGLNKRLDDMEDSLEIISIYIKKVENSLRDPSSMSFIDKFSHAYSLMKDDENNDYKILFSTPILENGKLDIGVESSNDSYIYKGDYLRFYNRDGIPFCASLTKFQMNDKVEVIEVDLSEEERESLVSTCSRYYADIMNISNSYSEQFKALTKNNLEFVTIGCYDFEKSWAAYTNSYRNNSKKCKMFIDILPALSNENSYNYQVGSYTHELGHVYDSATYSHPLEEIPLTNQIFHGISESSQWNEVFDQVNAVDADFTFLRDYAHSESVELFAEAVTEYYGNPQTDGWNPNDLRAVEIDIDGYDNLYDYMDSILN